MFDAADFWWGMIMACLVWYSTVTVYVAFRGAKDIRQMLARLKNQAQLSGQAQSAGQAQASGPEA